MHLSQIRSVNEPLRLGRLQGNHFDLVVRDLKPHGTGDKQFSGADTHAHLAALVEEAVENVKVFFFCRLDYFSAYCHLHIITLVLKFFIYNCVYIDTQLYFCVSCELTQMIHILDFTNLLAIILVWGVIVYGLY